MYKEGYFMMIRKNYVPLMMLGIATSLHAAQTVVKKEIAKPTVKSEAASDVAYVNAMETMQVSEKGIQKMTAIENKRKNLATVIEQKEQQIKQKITEYKSKESTLSTTAREKEESALVKMRREYESLAQSSEDELKLAMQRATEELSKDIEEAAAVLAKDGGYRVVVDVYSGRTIWADDSVIKTADLVKVMDKKHKLASAKPAASKVTA